MREGEERNEYLVRTKRGTMADLPHRPVVAGLDIRSQAILEAEVESEFRVLLPPCNDKRQTWTDGNPQNRHNSSCTVPAKHFK